MRRLFTWGLAACLCGTACGKKEEPAPEPLPELRELPGLGDPTEPPPPPPYDAGNPFGEGLEAVDAGRPCCPVPFALAAEDSPWGARLVGAEGPLASGVPLAFDGGTWTATVCVPAPYDAYYFYELLQLDTQTGEDGGLYADGRVNPWAPTGYDGTYGDVNWLKISAECESSSTSLHAFTSAPDAGP